MKFKTRILTTNSSFPASRLIRDAIAEITGKHYYLTANPQEGTHVVFRYGNSARVIGTDSCYNSKKFIEMAKDKQKFSIFCQEHGINSPIFYPANEFPGRFPVVIRETLTGWGGKGIKFCSNEQEFRRAIRPGYHWTNFVRTTYEIRLHLFDTRPNRIYKKVKEEGSVPFPIRNSENGYHFSLQSEDNPNKYRKARDLASRLGELFVEIGGHFCGIDMGFDPERREYFIFEINSAPGLNSTNANEYAKFLVSSLKLGENYNAVEENGKDDPGE